MHVFVFHRCWKIVAALALVGVFALVVFYTPNELESLKKAMKGRGEGLTLAEVASSFAPETAAVMNNLTGAVARLRVLTAHPSVISAMDKSTPGFAKVAWASETLVINKWVTKSWDDFHRQMRQNEPILAEIRALLQNPPLGPSYEVSDLFGRGGPPLLAKRSAAQWLLGAEIDALQRGALDEALADLHALIGLAHLNEEETMLVSQMIRVAIAGLAMAGTWEALQAPGWDDARLAALQKRWEELTFLARFERTLQTERAMGLVVFECARTNREKLNMLLPQGIGGIDSTNILAEAFNEDIYLPVWQKTWSRRDELLFLRAMEKVLEAIHKGNSSHSYAEVRPLLEQRDRKNLFSQFRFPLSDALVPNWRKALPRAMREESFRQMTISALAIKRYQMRHGKTPEHLHELVPEFLLAVPCDYMTGKDLLYQRKTAETYLLYSVGENGLDENGRGDDVIWPLPEFPQRGPERVSELTEGK